MTMTHVTDDELFGRTLPVHATLRVPARACVVCGLRAPRALDATHGLCVHCAAQPAASAAICAAHLDRIDRALDTTHAAWIARQAALDDALAERWTSLVQRRQLAAAQLQRAQYGRRPADETDAAYRVRLAAAQTAWDGLQHKIGRTRAASAAIAALLDDEAAYLASVRRVLREQQRWQMALADVEALS